jgi:hypothetical protein
LAVDQDALGVQGSLVNSGGDDATPCAACETYVKPLHDGSFAVVLLNKGEAPAQAAASFGRRGAQSTGGAYRNDFRPAGCDGGQVCGFARARVRDLWARRDLGTFEGSVNVTVEPHGAAMLRVTVLEWTPPPPPPCPPVAAEAVLHGNICQPPVLGGGGASKGSAACCLQWCASDPTCKFASFEAASTHWCIRYTSCLPCNASSGCGDCTKYTTYKMPETGGEASLGTAQTKTDGDKAGVTDQRGRSSSASASDELSFWQITDVHLNPAYPSGCGGCKSGLPEAPCGTFADYYCGSSPKLYESAMRFMSNTDGPPVSFVAHTGDFPDVWNAQNMNNHSYFLTNVHFQVTQLKTAFPHTPVFYALGNHDFPDTTGCPYMPGCSSHYNSVCDLFGADLDANATAMCKANGYYYVDHPKMPGVRAVVLNTEFFNWEGGVDLGDPIQSAAADAHLVWLQEALATAPGKAMILGHIPPTSSIPASEEGYTTGTMPGHTAPGVQLWWQSHIERYNKIVSLSKKVTYEVWGHVHVDTYYISRDGGGEAGTAPLIPPPLPPAPPVPVHLHGNICQPPLLTSGNTGADQDYKGCEALCRRTKGCKYFGYETTVGWCIAYPAPCVPCNASTTIECGGSSVKNYNTYEIAATSNHSASSNNSSNAVPPVGRGVLWVGLSLVASYPPKNGGVRRYSFDRATKAPTNIEQWYFDVESSSKTGQIAWHKSWSADDLRLPPPPPPPSRPTGGAGQTRKQDRRQRPQLELSPLDPTSLRRLALSWRTNHSAHAEFRARAFGKAPAARYPNCSGDGVVADRCRMTDACAVANAPLTEYALCLLNWRCDRDDLLRGGVCVAPPSEQIRPADQRLGPLKIDEAAPPRRPADAASVHLRGFPKCSCANMSLCLPLAHGPPAADVHVYSDGGGPCANGSERCDKRDDWSGFDFAVVSTLVMMSGHPISVGADGAVKVNDPVTWPLSAMLCAAHGQDTRVLVTVLTGDVRDKSDCHFRKAATEYDRKPGIKWLYCTTK